MLKQTPAVISCPYCTRQISGTARKCPECLSDLGRKSLFNLDGWSKFVGFITALITVTSLSADKLSAFYFYVFGKDASNIEMQITDAQFAGPEPGAKEPASAKLASLTVTATNFGRGPGVLFAQILCLADDLSKGDSREVKTWRLRAPTPSAIDEGKFAFVVIKDFDLSPIQYASREQAVAQWTDDGGKVYPMYTCRLEYADRHGFRGHRFTTPQQLLAIL